MQNNDDLNITIEGLRNSPISIKLWDATCSAFNELKWYRRNGEKQHSNLEEQVRILKIESEKWEHAYRTTERIRDVEHRVCIEKISKLENESEGESLKKSLRDALSDKQRIQIENKALQSKIDEAKWLLEATNIPFKLPDSVETRYFSGG